MEPEVSGAGLMFLGSGCGPALTDEQRLFLREVNPAEFYPLAHLLEMFEAAANHENDLLYATGRRWGAALNEDMRQRGATHARQAIRITCEDAYLAHHQGDVGQILVEDDGETAVVIISTGPYPMRLVAGMLQVLAANFSGTEAEFTLYDDDPRRIRISWQAGA